MRCELPPLLAGFPTRDTVVVAGPDALSFLNSLLSQDVAATPVGGGAHSLLLQPQGKLDVDLRVLRTGDEECRLDCQAGFGAGLVASLRRFKIRVKAEITDASAQIGVLSLRGEGVDALLLAAGAGALPGEANAHVAWPDNDSVRVVRADWPAPWKPGGAGVSPGNRAPGTGRVPGVDLSGPIDELARIAAAAVAAGAAAVGEPDWEVARVAVGVPRQGVDIDERTIPQEAFLERSAVSFTKGCFLGQELVCRIDSRGHVNRFLRGFDLGPGVEGGADDTIAPPGAGIVWGDKEVGMLTSVSASGIRGAGVSPGLEGRLALGYLRREVDVPTPVTIRWDGHETPAVAHPLNPPFLPSSGTALTGDAP